MKISLVTYLYNDGIRYISHFLDAVKKQSCNEFDLVIFNDGVQNAESYFNSFAGKKSVVDVSGTPTQIRIDSFKYLYKTDADHVIFQDIDDGMSINRIEVLSELLREYDIASNDLSLMNDGNIIYDEAIWADKLKDLFVFDYRFIKDKNIVGIGNSGIRRNLLGTDVKYSVTPKVGDWFIFYQLLFLNRASAVFTTKCQTFYRQHENNMAGVKQFDMQRLEYVIAVKRAHYLGLNEVGYEFTSEIQELNKIESEFKKHASVEPTGQNLFWWDETNHLIIN